MIHDTVWQLYIELDEQSLIYKFLCSPKSNYQSTPDNRLELDTAISNENQFFWSYWENDFFNRKQTVSGIWL